MNDTSLQQAILEGLLESGAPLEMRVAAQLMRAAHIIPARPQDLAMGTAFHTVSQEHQHWDSDKRVFRETDVIGVTWAKDRTASVRFVAECKRWLQAQQSFRNQVPDPPEEHRELAQPFLDERTAMSVDEVGRYAIDALDQVAAEVG